VTPVRTNPASHVVITKSPSGSFSPVHHPRTVVTAATSSEPLQEDGGGGGGYSAAATAAATTLLKKGNLFQVPHYFGVEIAELLSGTGNPTLPRLLVYVCEYLLGWSSRSPSTTISAWIASSPSKDLVKAARDQFDVGTFYDPKSPEVIFALLKTFFRELPSGLIPSSEYERCMDIVTESLKRTISLLRRNRLYKLLLKKFGPELDAVVERVSPRNTRLPSFFLLI